MEFHKKTSAKDGLMSICKVCNAAKAIAWQKKNPKRKRTYRTEYSIHSKKWYKENKELRKISMAKWQKENAYKCCAIEAKRRAAQMTRTPSWLKQEDSKEIESFYAIAKELQWLSEDKLEVDHIVPLQGKNVSGLHVPWNLQILPKSMNCSKNNRL
jgi:5-methylcytosine-specific restriction endonuclease McrA